MIRICRGCEVRLVARVAVGRRPDILVIHMALRARHADVHPGERVIGVRVVIELGVEPARRGVTDAAVMRQPDLRVRRILGPVEVCLVAPEARRRRALELVVEVAGLALQCSVHTGKRKPGHRKMIELGSEPAVHRVARFARDRKAGVIDDRCLEVLLMAVVAGCRESHELPNSSALVARGAFQRRVRADERKAVLMIFDIIDRHLPALDRVAVLAVGAELAHVNVSVTVSAVRTDIGKYQRCVAFRAAYLLMHSTQRILGLVVIEFGQRPDRLPACIGVTVLAVGDRGTVRVRHLRARAGSCLHLLFPVRGGGVRGLGIRPLLRRFAHEHRR